MKKLYIGLLAIVASITISTTVLASNTYAVSGDTAQYVSYAKIIGVEEVYRTAKVKRYSDCHEVTSHVQHQGDGNLLNEALSGIIGGLIGSQIGGGSGKTAATIAGIVIGGSIANKHEGTHTTAVTSTVCDTVHYDIVNQSISHYDVTYDLHGTTFVIREMSRPIGTEKRMTVSVTPYRQNIYPHTIGVDTTETKHPRKPVQCFGKEAYMFTSNIVEGKKVRLEFDQNQRDQYKPLLAYVYLEDGTFLNAEIIKQGYGHAYTQYKSFTGFLEP